VPPVLWLPWTADAFARARAEDKPVLLSIVAAWCASSRDMERRTYAAPRVAAIVGDGFVPIRVDADRRPDISDRYSLDGLPTTAFLTADGAIITAGTHIDAERMPSVLERVAAAFATRRAELAAEPVAPVAAAPADPLPDLDRLSDAVFSTFDRQHGGFGAEPKFPLTAPLELALDLWQESQDSHLARIVESTLDAIGWGALHDDVDGGFFRCAATRAWERPHREKLLDVNAGLLRIFIEASERLGIARYRDRAGDILRHAQTWLADTVDGGWAGSQAADDDYYALAADARRQSPPPSIDSALYTGWNGAMASSALRAAQILGDTGLGEFAIRSVERVLLGCYRPGAGVAHCLDVTAAAEPPVRGLLDDQILMATAQLDAHEATGNIVYQMMAQELAHYALQAMWDEHDGGFFDRSPVADDERVGLMRQRLKPFVANCQAARLLKRLAGATGDRTFADRAAATLAAMAPLALRQGPLAAHYVLAARQA
jgi:uncharacterized protein